MEQQRSFCPFCGNPVSKHASFCSVCGAKLDVQTEVQTPDCMQTADSLPISGSMQTEALQTTSCGTDSGKDMNTANHLCSPASSNESGFDGGAFALFGVNFCRALGSILSLGIALPWLTCWKYRWMTKHTYLNGRRQVFDGKGGQLIGKYLLWMLLTVVTLGIYGFWFSLNLERWMTKHTHFLGAESESRFNGSVFALFGINLATSFLSLITAGIASFWMHCWKERWFAKHRLIDGHALYFDGKGIQYLGKKIIWLLLTVVTLGIYSFWLTVKSKKWTVSHTFVSSPETIAFSESAVIRQRALPPDTANPKYGSSIVLAILSYFLFPAGIVLSIIGIVHAKACRRSGVIAASIIALIYNLTLLILYVIMIFINI